MSQRINASSSPFVLLRDSMPCHSTAAGDVTDQQHERRKLKPDKCTARFSNLQSVPRLAVVITAGRTFTMERWSGRVAVVTGASSGIGAAVAKDLVKHNMKVVGIARRLEKIEALKNDLKGLGGSLYPLKADVSREEEVVAAFSWVKNNLGGVDVLINNAGIIGRSTLHEGPVSQWKSVLDLNVLGLSICTKEALQSMREHGVDDGHIIHISSINGHGVPQHSLEYGLMMYSATKNAVQALTEGLRRELVQRSSKIKVTSVCPGMVETEIIIASGYKAAEGMTVEQFYSNYPHLKCQDICDAIIYILGTPPHVQVHDLIIKPVGEPM